MNSREEGEGCKRRRMDDAYQDTQIEKKTSDDSPIIFDSSKRCMSSQTNTPPKMVDFGVNTDLMEEEEEVSTSEKQTMTTVIRMVDVGCQTDPVVKKGVLLNEHAVQASIPSRSVGCEVSCQTPKDTIPKVEPIEYDCEGTSRGHIAYEYEDRYDTRRVTEDSYQMPQPLLDVKVEALPEDEERRINDLTRESSDKEDDGERYIGCNMMNMVMNKFELTDESTFVTKKGELRLSSDTKLFYTQKGAAAFYVDGSLYVPKRKRVDGFIVAQCVRKSCRSSILIERNSRFTKVRECSHGNDSDRVQMNRQVRAAQIDRLFGVSTKACVDKCMLAITSDTQIRIRRSSLAKRVRNIVKRGSNNTSSQVQCDTFGEDDRLDDEERLYDEERRDDKELRDDKERGDERRPPLYFPSKYKRKLSAKRDGKQSDI